jgi:hypothetical protein
MPVVSFCKCDCGIEIKLLQALGEVTEAYTCRCGRQFEFLGTIVELYTATEKTGFTKSVGWKPVSQVSMRASA